ncbi:maltose ABC transporter substrate-binding protein [Paenibacillus graminis]|uniref:sugar ABC transporter substrate-binding protein n=1 Tax=Paenibacillus graminis TaxID=189425 RepID=UPI002DC05A0A|nr:maltose ABC transporter substrate-binding protein [Paenibacillus graminis]MEC0169477.1 maltose ABC transporter substrate-binding protein [Paenibacillus graminis]
MKRKTGLILLLIVVIFAVTACGGGSPAGGPAASPASESPQQSSDAAVEELQPEPGAELLYWDKKDAFSEYAVQEFEKKYKVKVKLEEVMFWETVGRLNTDGPAGTGADVFVAGADQLGPNVNSGLFLPNDYFAEETSSISVKSALDAVTVDGILYGYPRNIESFMMYINKDIVKDAKLDTWDDVKAFAKKYNDIPNNKYGLFFETNNLLYNYSFMAGYGAYIFGKQGTDKNDIGLNNEGAVKGMEFYRSLKEILPVASADLTEDVKVSLFEQGKVGIILDGIWNLARYKSLPFEVGVIPMPKMPGGVDPKPYASVPAYFVSAYTKYPNASKLFAHFMTTKEMQLKNYEMRGVLPAYAGIENDEKLKPDEIIQVFSKHVSHAEMLPVIPEVQYFFQNMTPVLEQIWNGADIQSTLDKAVADMKANIAATQ